MGVSGIGDCYLAISPAATYKASIGDRIGKLTINNEKHHTGCRQVAAAKAGSVRDYGLAVVRHRSYGVRLQDNNA